MRFKFDAEEQKAEANPKRGIGFEQVEALLDEVHIIDQRSEDPEQCRAIGWVGESMHSVIYEVRQDQHGEFCHLVTLWKATKAERKAYAESV